MNYYSISYYFCHPMPPLQVIPEKNIFDSDENNFSGLQKNKVNQDGKFSFSSFSNLTKS